MKVDPAVIIQKQVRENTQDVENFMYDLKNWEEGIKKQEQKVFTSSGDNLTDDVVSVSRDDVNYVKSVFAVGVEQMKNEKWELAAASFSKAIKKYKKNPVFFIKRAKCYLKLKRANEAEADCSTALMLDPKFLKAKFYRSKARELKNNLRGACLDLQDIVVLDPANQAAKSALEKIKPTYLASIGCTSSKLFEEEAPSKEIGVLDVLRGDDAESLELEEKIQIANIEKELGNKLVKEEKWEAAKEAYSKAIMTYPEDAIFYANRAWCYMKTGNMERAIFDCSMALKKNPRYAKAYLRRATARKMIDDLWGARQDCKQLIQLEPNNNQAKRDLEELNILIEKSSCTDDMGESVNLSTAEEPLKKEFSYVFPINKPPHSRSKKPLKRIPIRFIDNDNKTNPTLPGKTVNNLPDWMTNPSPPPVSVAENEKSTTIVQKHPEPLIVQDKSKPKMEIPLPINGSLAKENTSHINDSTEKDFKYVFPINKKPHLRSKKPLQRIPIVFI